MRGLLIIVLLAGCRGGGGGRAAADARAAPACPSEALLEAVHETAYRLEHGSPDAARAALARATRLAAGPVDDETRRLLGRLSAAVAGDGDARAISEEVRADLTGWRCLTEEAHRRFHERLR